MSFVIFQPDRTWLKQLVKKYGQYVTGNILDIGAGEVDRYGQYLSFSKKTTADINPGAYTDVVASADRLPFADGEFDSVLCTQVLEHVPHPWLVVQELHRILKKGGTVLISVPLTAELHEEPNDFWRYTRYGIKQLFADNGFEVVHIAQEGGYYSMIAHIKIRHAINVYRLYARPLLGRVASKFFRMYGKFMIWYDKKNIDEFNQKHTLGYVAVVRKI